MTTGSSAQDARHFISLLAGVANRLATHGLVIARLHCDWSHFGSWQLQVQRGRDTDRYREAILRQEFDTWGPEVLRAVWDGRDEKLSIMSATTPPLSAPHSFEDKVDKRFSGVEAAIDYAEEYLEKWSADASA
jgi:hypothetical protein